MTRVRSQRINLHRNTNQVSCVRILSVLIGNITPKENGWRIHDLRVRYIFSALSLLDDPPASTVTWLHLIMRSFPSSIWYTRGEALEGDETHHFVADHHQYLEQYVIMGGSMTLPAKCSIAEVMTVRPTKKGNLEESLGYLLRSSCLLKEGRTRSIFEIPVGETEEDRSSSYSILLGLADIRGEGETSEHVQIMIEHMKVDSVPITLETVRLFSESIRNLEEKFREVDFPIEKLDLIYQFLEDPFYTVEDLLSS